MDRNLEDTAPRVDDARRALDESKKAAARSSRIVDAASEQIARMRASRLENHFTQRFAQVLRGES